MNIDKTLIKGFTDAQKLVDRAKLEVFSDEGESYAWHKLFNVKRYLISQQIAMCNAYFAEEGVTTNVAA